jgi:glutamine synthetase
VACALDDIATELEKEAANGLDPTKAARKVLTKFFEKHLPVVFNGNNYSSEWEVEAKKRGLWNLKDSVAALSHYSDPEVKDVFLRHGVLTERELLARQDILLENYIKAVHVETKLVQIIGRSTILPVALKSLQKAANLVASCASLPRPNNVSGKPEEVIYQRLYQHIAALSSLLDELDTRHLELDAMDGVLTRAEAARNILLPLLVKIRTEVDSLELIIDDALWPLPKYGELLWQ